MLAPQRRAELVAWARRRGTLIVEDDYDAEYRYDREPLASLQGLAPDCVAYVGTARKTLAPGVRIGWVLVPSHLVGEMTVQHGVARAMPSVFAQATYATLLERGEIDRHLRRTRRIYHARRNALIDALARWLPDAVVGGAAAGLHLIAWLPDGDEESAVSDAAAERGVAIHTLHQDCAVTASRPPALLLGLRDGGRAAIPRGRPGAGEGGDAVRRPESLASTLARHCQIGPSGPRATGAPVADRVPAAAPWTDDA